MTQESIPYTIERKPIKSVRVRVRQNGSVVVSAPLLYPQKQIERFVEERAGWIEKHVQARLNSPARNAEAATPEQIKEWRTWTQERTPVLVEEWSKRMGVTCTKLAYRNMKTQWGNCRPETGRICINIRLALYPEECLEYVVVHELAHLIERGHGPKFKAVMNQYLPDWKRRRSLLR